MMGNDIRSAMLAARIANTNERAAPLTMQALLAGILILRTEDGRWVVMDGESEAKAGFSTSEEAAEFALTRWMAGLVGVDAAGGVVARIKRENTRLRRVTARLAKR